MLFDRFIVNIFECKEMIPKTQASVFRCQVKRENLNA